MRTDSPSCVSPCHAPGRPDLTRQLSDVAEGLSYLHSCDVIHGDLNGVCNRSWYYFTAELTADQSNILVDATGHARITDFGLAMVTQDLDSIRGGSTRRNYSVRWIAPEILSNQGTHSKEADVFSLAGVAIEVRCGKPTRV
jgi:serine/threonine protein kinase